MQVKRRLTVKEQMEKSEREQQANEDKKQQGQEEIKQLESAMVYLIDDNLVLTDKSK